MAYRGFSDDPLVFVGCYMPQPLKRALVDRAVERGDSLSAEIRRVLAREVWPDESEQKRNKLVAV